MNRYIASQMSNEVEEDERIYQEYLDQTGIVSNEELTRRVLENKIKSEENFLRNNTAFIGNAQTRGITVEESLVIRRQNLLLPLEEATFEGQCSGRRMFDGKRCRLNGSQEDGRCIRHTEVEAGLAIVKSETSIVKSGRYSRVLPKSLAQKYSKQLQDNDLLELNDEIALIDMRVGEMLLMLPDNAGESSWIGAKKAFENLMIAVDNGDIDAVDSARKTMDDALNTGESEIAQWDSIVKMVDVRRKLVESQRKRLVEMQTTISADDVVGILAVIQNSIKARVLEYVEDREVARRIFEGIGQDLARILHGRNGRILS